MEAWFGKTFRSTIKLETLKEIDTRGNFAAILTNDHEIAFYNLNNGVKLDNLDLSSFFTKKSEFIESIQFNSVGQLKIKTNRCSVYYIDLKY